MLIIGNNYLIISPIPFNVYFYIFSRKFIQELRNIQKNNCVSTRGASSRRQRGDMFESWPDTLS